MTSHRHKPPKSDNPSSPTAARTPKQCSASTKPSKKKSPPFTLSLSKGEPTPLQSTHQGRGPPMSESTAFLLGIIQGITEWIPVSSQGVVALVSTWINDASPSDAIALALWLHVGTALSATIALRRDITSLIRNSLRHSGEGRNPARGPQGHNPPGHSALLAAHPELASVDPKLLEALPPGHPELLEGLPPGHPDPLPSFRRKPES
ncbi:MAG: undecaprenyl-diphosphate phosphatase, partial [Dehalococcoidia bacterium]|nr:undecaprenyl-diphosphate phosphatase [Dehalococcoidia bacterium]